MTDIKQGTNKFFIGEDEQHPDAVITFKHLEDDKIDVDHTFVTDELAGQGIAGQLVKTVVEHARDQGLTIVPTCSYAKHKLETIPAYHDVLAEGYL